MAALVGRFGGGRLYGRFGGRSGEPLWWPLWGAALVGRLGEAMLLYNSRR